VQTYFRAVDLRANRGQSPTIGAGKTDKYNDDHAEAVEEM
jgi:hypothetical protein